MSYSQAMTLMATTLYGAVVQNLRTSSPRKSLDISLRRPRLRLQAPHYLLLLGSCMPNAPVRRLAGSRDVKCHLPAASRPRPLSGHYRLVIGSRDARQLTSASTFRSSSLQVSKGCSFLRTFRVWPSAVHIINVGVVEARVKVWDRHICHRQWPTLQPGSVDLSTSIEDTRRPSRLSDITSMCKSSWSELAAVELSSSHLVYEVLDGSSRWPGTRSLSHDPYQALKLEHNLEHCKTSFEHEGFVPNRHDRNDH